MVNLKKWKPSAMPIGAPPIEPLCLAQKLEPPLTKRLLRQIFSITPGFWIPANKRRTLMTSLCKQNISIIEIPAFFARIFIDIKWF